MIENMEAVSQLDRLGGSIMRERFRSERPAQRRSLVCLLPGPLFAVVFSYRIRALVNFLPRITQEMLEEFTEEDYDNVDRTLDGTVAAINSVLRVATMLRWHRTKLTRDRAALAEARYAIARGYPPGSLPSREDRERTATQGVSRRELTNHGH